MGTEGDKNKPKGKLKSAIDFYSEKKNGKALYELWQMIQVDDADRMKENFRKNLKEIKGDFEKTIPVAGIEVETDPQIFCYLGSGEVINQNSSTGEFTIRFSATDFIVKFLENLNKEKPLFGAIKEKNKKLFIQSLVGSLYNYLNELPESKHPSTYKKNVLVGYMASCFDIIDDLEKWRKNTSPPYNYWTEYLSEQTKQHAKTTLKKLKKERPLGKISNP